MRVILLLALAVGFGYGAWLVYAESVCSAQSGTLVMVPFGYVCLREERL